MSCAKSSTFAWSTSGCSRALVKAGALDALAPAVPQGGVPLPPRVLRPRLMAALDAAVEHGARVQRDQRAWTGATVRRRRRGSRGSTLSSACCRCAAVDRHGAARAEKEALGLFWTGHRSIARGGPARRSAPGPSPISRAPNERRLPRTESGPPMPAARGGEDVTVGGIIVGFRPLKTSKGDRMAVFTLEDSSRRRRGRRLSRAVQACAHADRERRARPGARQARTRRRVDARSWLRKSCRSVRAGAPRARGRDHGQRPAASRRHSRRWRKSSRAIEGDQPVTFQLELKGSATGCACERRSRRISGPAVAGADASSSVGKARLRR